jgi:TetR/AcrR family acrAB operon transcriptional repressor
MKRTKTPSRKAEQSATTRDRVVRASMNLFAHRGIHYTSLDEIARRARITKGAIYWHFRGKDALVDAIFERIKEDWQRTVLRRLGDGASPMDKVDRLFANYRELLSKEPEICLFLQRAMLEANTKVGRKVNAVFDKTAKTIGAIFEEGKKTGLFAKELDSKLLAFSILSAFAGAVTHCHSDKTLQLAGLIDEIKQQTLARLTSGAREAEDRSHLLVAQRSTTSA